MEKPDLLNMNVELVMDEMCKAIVLCQATAETLRNSVNDYNKTVNNIKNAQTILATSINDRQLSEEMTKRVLELLKDAQTDIENFPELALIEKRE